MSPSPINTTTSTTTITITTLTEKITGALTQAKEICLALIICYRMPSAQALECEAERVIGVLGQLVDHVESRAADLEAADVAVERCNDVLTGIQEALEGFLDVENARHSARG